MLDAIIGDGVKRVEANEQGTIVVQRRAVRAARDLAPGEVLARNDLTVLRPCPLDALPPYRLLEVLGKPLARAIPVGDRVRLTDLR